MNADYTTEDYIRQLKHSPDPDERLYAAFKLGRDKQAIVVQPLIEASDDSEYSVRVRVAEALGTRDNAHMVSSTLLKLLADTHVAVRRAAAASLGKVQAFDAVSALVQALTDVDADVRAQVAEALGEIASDEASDALVQTFLHDEDANVRYFARQSLGKMGFGALDALLEATDHTTDPDLLCELCEVLGTLADARARATLTRLSTHTDTSVREMAQWALQQIEHGSHK